MERSLLWNGTDCSVTGQTHGVNLWLPLNDWSCQMESCMVVMTSRPGAVFQCLCVAEEPDGWRLLSALQLCSSVQLFPIAQGNADSLPKLTLINTALKFFSVPPKWDSYLNGTCTSPPESGPEISSAGSSMVLITPGLWVWCLSGPFTLKLGLTILGGPSNSEHSVVLFCTNCAVFLGFSLNGSSWNPWWCQENPWHRVLHLQC